MSTYRQRMDALDAVRAMREANLAKEEAEQARKMSMDIVECYRAGFSRGIEDARDSYTGALENKGLGNDYAYPEEYRQGYRRGYFPDYFSGLVSPLSSVTCKKFSREGKDYSR